MDRKKSYQQNIQRRKNKKKKKKWLPKIMFSQTFLLSKQFVSPTLVCRKEEKRSKNFLPKRFILVNKIYWAKNKRFDFLKKKKWLIKKNILNNNCANTIFANKRNISCKEIVCHRQTKRKKYTWTR